MLDLVSKGTAMSCQLQETAGWSVYTDGLRLQRLADGQ